ncbi:hypothetical protein OROHE_014940 [Orobanche hederae]
MASSQTSSLSLKKKESIIDGRGFDRFIIMETVKMEVDDLDAMELVVSRNKQQGFYRLGNPCPQLYDERIIEEFHLDASVRFYSLKRGGDVADITAAIHGVEIYINRELLEDIFRLPSDGLNMEELEILGSQEI